jgi:anti-sigma B factor antagonist
MQINNVMVIILAGKIDLASGKQLDEHLKKQVLIGNVKFILDLKNVSLTNSDGLRILLNSIKRIRSREGDICLVNTSPLIQDILITTGFSNQFQIFTDMNTALINF